MVNTRTDRNPDGTDTTPPADTLTKVGAAAAVLMVAAIAAVVSFVHIDHLAITHGQPVLAGALLPLSIDGTVAAASLVMLRAARSGLGTPGLARFMLALAVLATLLANITYGLPYGPVGALVSGWPAVAFIGCAELAIGMVRRFTPGTDPEPAELAAEPDPADLTAMSKADAIRIALAQTGGRVTEAQRWLSDHAGIRADRAYMHDVKRGASGKGRRNRAGPEPAELSDLAPSANGHRPGVTV